MAANPPLQPQQHPAFIRYIESLDALVNLAKVNGQYQQVVGALFTCTAIVLGELDDAGKADATLEMIAKQQNVFRQKRITTAAADAATTGAPQA